MTCPLAKPAGPRPPGQSSCATPCCLAGCRPRLQGAALGHPQSQATRSSALGPQRCRYRRHGSPAPGGATSSHNAGRLEAEKCDSDAPVYRCRGAYATASHCLSMTSPKLFCTPDHTRSTRISHERLTAHSIIRSNGRRRTWYFPSQTSASSCLTADWPRLTSEITSSSLEYACSLRRCSLRSVPRIRCSCLDVFNSTTCKEQNAGNQQHALQPLRAMSAYRVTLLSALLYPCQSFELCLGFILLGLQLIHVALRCIRISACCLQLSQPFLRPHLPLHKLVL